MLFDARAAKALAPGAHLVVGECAGLRLEATATRKTWTYRYRSPLDGKLRQVRIGHWPAVSLADAIGAWRALREQRGQGVELAAQARRQRTPAVVPQVYTVGRMIEDYAAGYLAKNRAANGARAVAARLRKALAKHIGRPAESMDRALVFGVIEGLSGTPVVARSVKAEMAAAQRFAVEAGHVADTAPNWWAERTSHRLRSKGALRAGQHKGTGKRVLTGDEVRALVAQDLALFSPQVRDFLTLQLWTCARGGEICQMRRGQVREESTGLWWTLPKAETKGRHVDAAHDLRVPLLGRAEVIVRRLMEGPGEWLFPSVSRLGETRGQSQAYMQSKVHYLQPYSQSKPKHKRTRLTVTHWSPHDLRRTGRTMLAALGCPHEVAEAIIGHVLPGVAGAYNLHRYDDERRLWLTRLSEHYERLIAPAP